MPRNRKPHRYRLYAEQRLNPVGKSLVSYIPFESAQPKEDKIRREFTES